MTTRITWQQTMNTQIAKSMQLFESVEDQQPILDKGFYSTAITSFQTSQASVQLTAEEEALERPTVIRIEAQKIIDMYILSCKNSYEAMNRTQDAPAWVLLDKNHTSDYSEFFAEIESVDTELVRRCEYDTGVSLMQLQDLYSQWLDAKADESLDETVKVKIHAAIDLRNAITALVKLYGYGDKEIGEVLR